MKPHSIDESQIHSLTKLAGKALDQAYAPYSGYKVGAALLTGNGRVFTGANIENAAFGESLCAERVAIAKAVSAGERDLTALIVVTADGRGASPCGSCRQVVLEFNPDCQIIMVGDKTIRIRPVKDLLPEAFSGTGLVGQD